MFVLDLCEFSKDNRRVVDEGSAVSKVDVKFCVFREIKNKADTDFYFQV